MPSEIGEFLRARRGRVRPEEVGLPAGGRRRVPGLRRDELAQLAGVSVEYYVRLEQGRAPNVSDAILDALAGVLRLSDVEREHLARLVRGPERAVRAERAPRLREGLRAVLDALSVPAFVMGRRTDVVAWNRLGDALYGFSALPQADRNSARSLFLRPESREFYLDWDKAAEETVAQLRLDAGRHPGDAKLASLVGELSIADPVFRSLWAAHGVREKSSGRKRLHHGLVGPLDLRYECLRGPGDPDHMLVSYHAEPASETAERLALLASWTTPDPLPVERPSHLD